MIDEILEDAESRMAKSVASLQKEFSRIRTGRAHVSLLDGLTVEYYGAETPLSQVANVVVEDARTLAVNPWEKAMVAPIEKAIIDSDLGLNPNTAGMSIRIPLPPLTEERRKDLVRIVRGEAEGGRVAIRNIRRDANSDFKQLEKEKEISEDEERGGQDSVQKLTDKFVAEVDSVLSEKEKDLMEM